MSDPTGEEAVILEHLRAAGALGPGPAALEPMTGGVSSDVWLVRQEGRPPFVAKRSVARLRVKADWRADPARLRYEFLYLQTATAIEPGCVPRLLSADPDAPVIAMEYLGAGFDNWKTLLLAGRIDGEQARRAGRILGRIHAATTTNAAVSALFPSMQYFTQLRIEAYLRAAAGLQPADAAAALHAEADRLAGHRECLVHGDFSPKNLLVSGDRLVMLDCETACIGDPAFDAAFLLNHLFLKGLYHSGRAAARAALPALRGAAEAFQAAYAQEQPARAEAVLARAARLLPMLLLARVDGKSPVEYLGEEEREFVRQFARPWLPSPPQDPNALAAEWFGALAARAPAAAQ